MRPFLLATLLLGAACAPAHATGGGDWLSDFDAAKAKAAKEGKDLLLNFTGSDWCYWCHRLEGEVFDKDAFKAAVAEHFVLVFLDFPQTKKLEEKLLAQNQRLQKAFMIQGFPTIVLTDASGRGYARTGYREGGPEKYLEHLTKLRAKRLERDRLFGMAAQTKDKIGKARLLDQALGLIDEQVLVGYEGVIAQIEQLDADGTAGLQTKWRGRAAVKATLTKIDAAMAEGKTDEALGAIASVMKKYDLQPTQRQNLLVTKTMILGQAKGDRAAAMVALKAAIKAAPDSSQATNLRDVLRRLEEAAARTKKGPTSRKSGR